MPTSFVFTPVQLDTIRRLRDESLARGNVIGAFKPMYDYIEQQIGSTPYTGADKSQVDFVRTAMQSFITSSGKKHRTLPAAISMVRSSRLASISTMMRSWTA